MKNKKDIINLCIIILSLILGILIDNNICSIFFFLISFIYAYDYLLKNINILNQDCDPIKFFEKNKNKEKQYLNCCFAILHMWTEDLNEIFLEYLEKAKTKKHQDNIYKMKLEYLEIYHKKLLGEEVEELEVEYNNNWLNSIFSIMEMKRIREFHKPKGKFACMLDTVIYYYDEGVKHYNNKEFELAKNELNYVKKYGGTTIYKRNAENLITDSVETNIKPKISLKEELILYKGFIINLLAFYLIAIIIFL